MVDVLGYHYLSGTYLVKAFAGIEYGNARMYMSQHPNLNVSCGMFKSLYFRVALEDDGMVG